MSFIYLDNNSTTPVYPEVRDAITDVLGSISGNPSSAHESGRLAKRAVELARQEVAAFLGAEEPGEILFTSGGTEADNLAFGVFSKISGKTPHLITTRVEHEAIRRPAELLESSGCKVTWLDVDFEGRLDLVQLEQSLKEDTALVSVMFANNETGVVFPIHEIAEIVKERSHALFHVDAVNAAGKIPISLADSRIDMLSISAHKTGGPKGVGALYVRQGVSVEPFMIGGGQESARRAGTEAVHQIVGFGVAATISADLSTMSRIQSLRDRLESDLTAEFPNARVNGGSEMIERLPNTTNISFPGINGDVILNLLDKAGVCVSTGSACNSESRNVSPVLKAMGIPFEHAMGSIRFSIGRQNTEEELNKAIPLITETVRKAMSFAGL
jgi:cysteine desulfurase